MNGFAGKSPNFTFLNVQQITKHISKLLSSYLNMFDIDKLQGFF